MQTTFQNTIQILYSVTLPQNDLSSRLYRIITGKWNLVYHINGVTQAGDFIEQGAEDDINFKGRK